MPAAQPVEPVGGGDEPVAELVARGAERPEVLGLQGQPEIPRLAEREAGSQRADREGIAADEDGVAAAAGGRHRHLGSGSGVRDLDPLGLERLGRHDAAGGDEDESGRKGQPGARFSRHSRS